MDAWVDDVLHFWFDHVGPDRWFHGDAALDEEVRERFAPLWESLRQEPALMFVADPRTALAAVVLFDQFPRNMFRKEADAFATDPLALDVAKLALDAGFDGALSGPERQMLYTPFMHSESLADQDRSVELFERLGEAEPLRFAHLHRDLIARFGRFPHRNAVLGRETTPEELPVIAVGSDW